jgi:hypothetical protein
MPQSVWCTTNHSFVPSSLCEMTSERIASSLARPPAVDLWWRELLEPDLVAQLSQAPR